MKWYHGTTPESAALIREHGFDMSKAGQRDVGDLGLGIYFTRNIARARSYGSELVAVELLEKLGGIERHDAPLATPVSGGRHRQTVLNGQP